MTDLLKLATRCEQATGPDREIDALIHAHVVLAEFADDADPERCLAVVRDEAINGPFYDGSPIESFTASLDAAMTLVPEGWAAIVGAYPDARKPFARLFPPDFANSPFEHQEGNDCASHALALCAAALRARAAQ